MKKFNFKKQVTLKANLALILAIALITFSCEFIDDLPEANSIADETPPTALFSFSNGALIEDFTQVSFANQSSDATMYSWDFGDGNTSSEFDPINVYAGEGTFTVTLVSSDALGQTSTFSQIIELIEPEAPAVPDPILVNADFNKLPKNNGNSSDCACSGWDNDDIGEQGESSSGNGGSDNVVKFDNNEPDHVYQEFAVTPNASYKIEIVTSFKNLENNVPPMDSSLELRVLAGSGYNAGYTPIYYATATEFPNSGYGYTSVAQVEDSANNLLIQPIINPGNDDYNTQIYVFDSGANDSVALFIRGLGGSTGGNYGYNSGDEEIRADSVIITAIN